MISRFVCFFTVLSGFFFCQAQNPPSGYDVGANLNDFVEGRSDYIRSFKSGYEGIRGTPNVFEDFRKGNLYFTNKISVAGIMINYDCYNDNILYTEKDHIYIINGKNIDFFTIENGWGSGNLLFKQVFLESEKKIIFLQIIYECQSTLFKRYKKKFIEADYTGPYNADRRYDEYIDDQDYYIKLTDGKIRQIKTRKKHIKEIFGDKSTMILEFIKEENIDLKDENDLVQLVEYYDKIKVNE
jgi:hypothetical protein